MSSAYIKYETAWVPQPCPRCAEETATGHGWLFREPPPTSQTQDTRKPVGQVFLHDDRDDCVVMMANAPTQP
jgi:hypothetical protein